MFVVQKNEKKKSTYSKGLRQICVSGPIHRCWVLVLVSSPVIVTSRWFSLLGAIITVHLFYFVS